MTEGCLHDIPRNLENHSFNLEGESEWRFTDSTNVADEGCGFLSDLFSVYVRL